MAADAILIGLGCFALTWFFSFWFKTEWLRDKLGIWYITDTADEIVDREDVGGVGAWINCPQCAIILALPITLLLWLFFKPALVVLAAIGVGQLAVRWYEGARVKARWWT